MTNVHEPPPKAPRGSFLASTTVRVIGLWILAGALFKLFQGTPADLPPVVREFPFPDDLGLKYKLAIGIELCIVTLALLRPRWGWVLVGLQLVVFIVVLIYTLDEPSCGCFGGDITMPPWLMLAIDGVLLFALLATMPWKRIRGRGMPIVVLTLLCAGGIAWPWFYDRQVTEPVTFTQDGIEQEGNWVIFDLARWVGKDITETEFALVHEDPYKLPHDGLWVFWRSTCDHCADHLRQLRDEDDLTQMITLIRLRETIDTMGNRVVHEMPEGSHVIHVDLPDSIRYMITTPGVLEMDGYVVQSGEEALGMDEEERKAEEERLRGK